MGRISYIDQMEEWRAGFSFKVPIKVRFSETDMFQHVNNTVPFVYFEEVRMEFIDSLGLNEIWLSSDSDEMPVVADLQCDFIQQVYFGEKLWVHAKLGKVGNSSFDIHYMVTKEADNSICYTGRSMMVQISKSTGKSVPWNEEMKRKLKVTVTF